MATSTSTILFTDVVGSTLLRSRLGEDEADRVFRGLERSFADVVTAQAGRVVKTGGDGIMAAFDSSTDAVRAAVALQQRASRDFPELRVRVGAAAGDVSWEDGDCFGMPVVTAARLQARAEGGQILVTAIVRGLAGDRSGMTFRALGVMDLAGVPHPVDAFEVGWSLMPAQDARSAFDVPLPAAVRLDPTFSFVGREAEWGQLNVAWRAAQREQRRTCLLGGEAGAGKTRLAFEFARHCAEEGAAVVLGVCDAELAQPYQPWVQILDQLVRSMPAAVITALQEDLAHTSVLLPTLERLVPGLTMVPAADPETERYRLFHAIDSILSAVAQDRALVLIVDDLHWAGTQTLALLRHLARSSSPSCLLIIGTFRDTGDEITEPLAGCLADLRRTDVVSRVSLAALDRDAVERLVAAMVGHELDGALRSLAATLAEHSGGNAFYVGELWRHLVASGMVVRTSRRWVVRAGTADLGVPDSVREVVADRLTRLSSAARQLVELAAVAGLRVELRVLAAAAGSGPIAVGPALDELLQAKFLLEVGGTAPVYEFAHAIVRGTVEQTVSPSTRLRLHQRVAEAIEEVHEADRRPVLAELARHFAASAPLGELAKAVYYARRAAVQAMRSLAHEEAIRHLQVALELTPTGSPEGVDILYDLGEAESRAGLHVDARESFARAFDAARALGLTERAATAAMGFDSASQMPGLHGGRSVEMISEALSLIGADDSPLRTRLQAALARALRMAGREAEAAVIGDEALAAARRHRDPQLVLFALQCALTRLTDSARYAADAGEARDIARQLDDLWGYCYASGCYVRGLLMLGRVAEATAALDDHRRAAERGRYVLYQYMAMTFDVMLAMIAGRFDDAERLAEVAHEFGSSSRSEFDAGVHGLQMYAIRREQGRLAEVAPVLRLAAGVASEAAAWRPGLAALLAEVGMLDEARRVFASLAPDGFAAIPRDAMWPCCLVFLAEVCTALGDEEHAELLYRELKSFEGFTMTVAFTVCLGPADRLMGSLAALVGRRADAEQHFRVALALAEQAGSGPWRARVQHDWAMAMPERRSLLVDAHATAVDLGMADLALRTGLVSVTSSPARASEPTLPDGLSAREAEVLLLIGAGLSNREIGERLFISQNTAANHVRAILQKTVSANRAEATAYGARHGLLGP